MNRSDLIDFINSSIREADSRATSSELTAKTLRQAAESMREILTYVQETPAPEKSEPDEVYYVASRTGGNPHYPSYTDSSESWSCTCVAGRNGRECWALRGVRSRGWSADNTFIDNWGITRNFVRLNK